MDLRCLVGASLGAGLPRRATTKAKFGGQVLVIISRLANYTDSALGSLLRALSDQGYDAQVQEGCIVLAYEGLNNPNGAAADNILSWLAVDLPELVVDELG